MASRPCKSTQTLSGKPCTHLVEDGHDHCAAGHYCPPIVSAKPAKAPAKVTLSSSQFSLDDMAGNPKAAADAERGEKRGAYLAVFLKEKNPNPIEYVGTVRGSRPRLIGEGTRPFRFDRYKVGDLRLACGHDGHGDKEWYLERECGEDGCVDSAFVRLRDVTVARPDDPEVLSDRQDAFWNAVNSAFDVPAKCRHPPRPKGRGLWAGPTSPGVPDQVNLERR